MFNNVQIIGRVGKDPEVRSMQSGGKVATLSVATSESWKDKTTGERKEKTEWHRVAVFNDALVGVVEKYINKGELVFIQGQLQTRVYEKDCVKHYVTEIVVKGNGVIRCLCPIPVETPATPETPDEAMPF